VVECGNGGIEWKRNEWLKKKLGVRGRVKMKGLGCSKGKVMMIREIEE
jgi:hypothetical protein